MNDGLPSETSPAPARGVSVDVNTELRCGFINVVVIVKVRIFGRIGLQRGFLNQV